MEEIISQMANEIIKIVEQIILIQAAEITIPATITKISNMMEKRATIITMREGIIITIITIVALITATTIIIAIIGRVMVITALIKNKKIDKIYSLLPIFLKEVLHIN